MTLLHPKADQRKNDEKGKKDENVNVYEDISSIDIKEEFQGKLGFSPIIQEVAFLK